MNLSPRAVLTTILEWLRKLFAGEPRRLVLRWGLILAAALLVYLFAYPHFDAYYHSRQAARALAHHDCASARRHLEICLRTWPESARLQFDAARCSWREGDPDAAQEHLREAARLGWPTKAVDLEALLIAAQLELTAPVAASLADQLKFAKDDKTEHSESELYAIALEAMILAQRRAGRVGAASMFANLLIETAPDDWRSYWLLGFALEEQNPDAAADAYERSVSMRAQQPKVHRWLAVYSVRMARPKETLDHLRASAPVDPGDVDAMLAEAKARLLLGQFGDARTMLARAWNHGAEQKAWAWTLRGRLELDEYGPSQAAPWLAQAEKLTPYNPETLDALIALAARQGDTEKVKRYQQRKQQFTKANEEVVVLGKKMEKWYRQANAKPGDMEDTAFRLGQLMFVTNHDEAGVKWMQSVLADNPHHAGAHRALADYYERIGALEQASAHRRGTVQKQEGP